MTDAELDKRVTALEENGGGETQNGRNKYFISFMICKENYIHFTHRPWTSLFC